MIYLGSDHAGHELKLEVAAYLDERGLEYRDLGNVINDPDDDYPDYAFPVAEAVAKEDDAYGILACGSAQGVCIAANKVKGVRAAAVATPEEARKTREHNAANVLCLSGWKGSIEDVVPVIDAFIGTEFSDEERHARRLAKIRAYEDQHAR
jgi:ribose 5-phosphate isomerase B